MPIEADVDTPRSVVEQLTSEWLDRVEASVERAHAALLGSERAGSAAVLERDGIRLPGKSRFDGNTRGGGSSGTLRERLTLLQVMLRQAAALIEGRAQLETQTFLGYTPRGLERAL